MRRRLVALVLMLCFGLFSAEGLLADVHDGDAAHEELVRVDGASEHAAAHVAHGDDPALADANAHGPAPDHPGERSPDEPGHGQHACHCAHVHGGWLKVARLITTSVVDRHLAPIAFHGQAPLNRDDEPQLRPPIA